MTNDDLLVAANVTPKYASAAKIIHWVMAIIIVTAFTLGWSLDDLKGADLPDALSAHAFCGLLVFALAVLRTAWRYAHPPLPLEVAASPGRGRLAGSMHTVLYALMFLVPMTGLLAASAHETQVNVIGLDLRSAQCFLGNEGIEIKVALHWTMQTLLMLLVTFHIGAALFHQFWLKDGVMSRMMPDRRSGKELGT